MFDGTMRLVIRVSRGWGIRGQNPGKQAGMSRDYHAGCPLRHWLQTRAILATTFNCLVLPVPVHFHNGWILATGSLANLRPRRSGPVATSVIDYSQVNNHFSVHFTLRMTSLILLAMIRFRRQVNLRRSFFARSHE